MGESISTIQSSPRISTSHKFAALAWSAAADCLADCSGERRTSPFNGDPQSGNGIEKSLSRVIVPKDKVSACLLYHVSNSVVFVHRAGTLAKGHPTAIQAVLKGRTVAIWKGNKHQLGLFFLLEACQRNAARSSTAGWPANAKLPLPNRHSSISLDPAARALKRQDPCLYMHMHSSTRQAQNASTCRRDVEVIICMIIKVVNNSLELTRIFKESFKDQRWAWEKSVRAEERDRDAEREKDTLRRQRHHL